MQAKSTRSMGDWFGIYSEGESGPDMGISDRAPGGHDGWEFSADNPYAATDNGHSAEWYHESPSGAWKEAWQTHYPAEQATGAWQMTGGGRWKEDRRPAGPEGPGKIRADWFDGSVGNHDTFGRPRAPDPDSPRTFLFWQERSVNTTLSCNEAGCTGETLLQAFDKSKEEVNRCKLSLFLHPTDFDDQYSGERLAWIKVNGQVVNTDCFPMISGCNASSQALLYPCLQDLPLDSIITDTGTLNISAQISDTVDECPYDGHLMAAVPMVTCLVAPKPEQAQLLEAPREPLLPEDELAGTPLDLHATAPLRCMERGCVARASINPDSEVTMQLRKLPTLCKMNVLLYQTDFDGEEGTPEMIEYLKVGQSTLVSDFAPGRNPCRSQWAGDPLPEDRKSFMMIRDQDVTEPFLLDGGLHVEARITDFVDECAHNGYLLDGLVELHCGTNNSSQPLGNPTSPQPSSTTPEPEPPMTTSLLSLPPLPEEPTLPPLPTLVTPAPAPAVRVSAPRDQAVPTLATEKPTEEPTTEAPTTEAPTTPEPTDPPVPTPAPAPPDDEDLEVVTAPAPTPEPAPFRPGLQIAPFGKPSTGEMLDQHSERSQDLLVDAIERAQASEIKRAIFRSLTKLRAAQIKEFDTIARIESTAIGDFNDYHHFRRENPLRYLHDNEAPVSTDKYWTFAGGPR